MKKTPSTRFMLAQGRFLLILVGLAAISVRLNAQIPDAWTQEKLKKLYGGEVMIASSNGHIKSVAFVKPNPQSFHGGECFALIIMVLRGPGAPVLHGDDADIKVTSKGDTTIWTDKTTGYSVDDSGPDFGFFAKLKGVLRVKASVVEGKNDSRFVLTDVK
jgi:hypothetical protein